MGFFNFQKIKLFKPIVTTPGLTPEQILTMASRSITFASQTPYTIASASMLRPFANIFAASPIAALCHNGANRIYAAGNSGHIYHTDDFGATPWVFDSFAAGTNYSLSCFRNILVLVRASQVLFSIDSGVTFNVQMSGISVPSQSLNGNRYNPANGQFYYCGSGAASASVIATTSDGVNFTNVTIPSASINGSISCLGFHNGKIYFGTTTGRIYAISQTLALATLEAITSNYQAATAPRDIVSLNNVLYVSYASAIVQYIEPPETISCPDYTGGFAGRSVAIVDGKIMTTNSLGFSVMDV